MASERRTEVKTKAATGPPVIAGGYAVPAKAVFVKRRRTEVGYARLPPWGGRFLLQNVMVRQFERRTK